MKAALYLRVSTRDKGQTTDNQLAQLREWCAHKGHDIAAPVAEALRLGNDNRVGAEGF